MSHLKNAARQLNRRPGLSVVIIAILALGIGVTTGIFSLFHQVLIRPLPVPEPERLVNLSPTPIPVFSYPMFRDLETRQSAFTGLATYDDIPANLTYDDSPRSGTSMAVSGGYFGTLGLSPALGRLIGPQDEPTLDQSRVVVLSHDYWERDFGSDPGVVGRTLTVNGEALTIIGVAPAGFSSTTFESDPEVFVPLSLRFLLRGIPRDQAQNRFAFGLPVFGRLRPDVELEQASAGINALHTGIIDDVESSFESSLDAPREIVLEPGAQGQRSEIAAMFARPLSLLLAVTVVVLLVVCSNVANLLLARGATRADEMAIRAAIGAGRRQLASQLLAEVALLALVGGLLSLPIAAVTLEVIGVFVPDGAIGGVAAELSLAAVLFAAAMSLSTVLLFGLAPAFQAAGSGARLTVSNPVSHSPGGRGLVRLRSALITSQIALSVILLVMAGLFAQSLANIARVNLGVDVESIVTFSVAPRLSGYDAERANTSYETIQRELLAQPGVAAVGSATIPLLTGSRFVRGVEGFDVGPNVDQLVPINFVTPGFFATLGVPLLAGRDFAATDTPDSPTVVIVNESFARRFNLGDDAIGRRFRPAGADADLEIVGLVADAAHSGSGVKAEIPAQYYQPLSQVDLSPSRYFYVRTGANPNALMRTIPAVVSGVDPNLPVDNLRTMETQFQNDVYVDRLVTALSASFAILATLLAAVGLYGMLAYTVAQRTRELGLRLALGAAPGRLRAMVLKQVGVMFVIGSVAGLAVALGLGRIIEALLFGVSGYDPVAFVAAVVLLCLVLVAASYFPARSASRIAPIAALRYE